MQKNAKSEKIDLTPENKNRYAYARVSTDKQLLDRQIDMLHAFDISDEHYFTDTLSGTRRHRPGFDALMERLEPGDELYVESFSRLSRSTKDLLGIIEELDKRKVTVHSLHEKFDTGTASGRFMLTMVIALSQCERDVLSERTKEGLASARARGHMGGRPSADKESLSIAFALYDEGSMTIAEICKATGIAESTFFKYNKMRKNSKDSNA